MKGFWALGLLDVAVRLVFGFLEAALGQFFPPPLLDKNCERCEAQDNGGVRQLRGMPTWHRFPKPLNP